MHKRFLPALLLVSCVPSYEGPDHDHGAEVVLEQPLDAAWRSEGAYLISPPLESEEGASRIAAMVTVGAPLEGDLMARADDGEWVQLAEVFREEALAVMRADLPEGSKTVELRVPATRAADVERLTYGLSVPEPEETISTDRRGLLPELASAGILPRSAWGARARRCRTPESTKIRMAIHHSVTARTSGGRVEPVLRQIQSYHMDGRGYCDMAYHFAVSADGRVWEGRDVLSRGGHSRNYNSRNIGIVMLGCFHSSCSGNTAVPNAMMNGLASAVRTFSDRFGISINSSRIKGHGEQPFQSTACPGDRMRPRMEELRQRARAIGSAPPPPPPTTTPPSQAGGACGVVGSNQLLARGTSKSACNGLYQLVHQSDGNVVLYNTYSNTPVWFTGTHGRGTTALIMQGDGNLVLYDHTTVRWSSGTHGRSGARLLVRDDGNMVIRHGTRNVWATNTTGAGGAPPPPPPPPPPTNCGLLASGGSLAPGAGVRSCDGRFLFVHQTDGNVVLYRGTTPLFSTSTHGRRTTTLAMQTDGNLVLYDGSRPLWSTGTHGHGGARLAVQDDGNVVVYTPSNHPVFATGTHGN